MCEQADEAVLQFSVEDAPVGGEDDGGNGEVNVGDMEPSEVIEEDDAESGEDRSADRGIALVKVRFERAGGSEGLCLTAEPFGEQEGADDGKRNVGSHPELSAGTALASCIARGKIKGDFAEAVGDQSGKA